MKEKIEVTLSSDARDFTQQAVVIGCSHEDSECNHEIHPSKEHFYTIDIEATFNPDLTLDITTNEFPKNLEKKFKLAILEHSEVAAKKH